MQRENKIVYITGCLGFIGSYVTRACLEQGWYVRGIDKITYADDEYNYHKTIMYQIEKKLYIIYG